MTITKTLKVTAVMAVLTFATFFMASGFSSLTMGSYPISDVFAQGGQNTANQGISQSNSASTSAQCAAGTLKGPSCNSTTNQGNVNSGSNTAGQKLVVELELVLQLNLNILMPNFQVKMRFHLKILKQQVRQPLMLLELIA